MNRKRHRWTVQLQQDDGQIKEVPFEAFWSPEHDCVTTESIANACAAQMHVAAGGDSRTPKKFVGISAVYQGTV